MRKYVPLFLFIISGFSCQSSTENVVTYVNVNGEKIPEIHMSNLPDNVVEVGISEIVSDFDFIPLEMKEDCLIGSIMALSVINDRLMVSTQQYPSPAPIYMFDLDGIFIREVGNGGSGPGEHSEQIVRSIHGSDIIIVNFQKKVQVFDLSGNFIKDVKKPFNKMGDAYAYTDTVYFSTGTLTGHPFYKGDSVMIVFHDSKGRVIKNIPRQIYPPGVQNGFTPNDWGNSIYRYEKQWNLYMPGLDTLYRIENMNLIPKLVFDFGGMRNDYNKIINPEEMIGQYEFSIVGENENCWIFRNQKITKAEVRKVQPNSWLTNFDSYVELVFINKKDYTCKRIRLIDDIWGLANSRSVNRYSRFIDSNRFVYEMQASDIKVLISEKLQDNGLGPEIRLRLKDLDSHIREESNPVLFIYRLKKNI